MVGSLVFRTEFRFEKAMRVCKEALKLSARERSWGIFLDKFRNEMHLLSCEGGSMDDHCFSELLLTDRGLFALYFLDIFVQVVSYLFLREERGEHFIDQEGAVCSYFLREHLLSQEVKDSFWLNYRPTVAHFADSISSLEWIISEPFSPPSRWLCLDIV